MKDYEMIKRCQDLSKRLLPLLARVDDVLAGDLNVIVKQAFIITMIGHYICDLCIHVSTFCSPPRIRMKFNLQYIKMDEVR